MKKHSCDWQRARAANDRHVIGSHVKNSISFKSECYNESVGELVGVLQCIPLWGNLSSAVVQKFLQTS